MTLIAICNNSLLVPTTFLSLSLIIYGYNNIMLNSSMHVEKKMFLRGVTATEPPIYLFDNVNFHTPATSGNMYKTYYQCFIACT